MRRLAVALALTLAACGGGGPSKPEWAGQAPLATDRMTVTQYDVTKVTPKDPAKAAARLLGVSSVQLGSTEPITAERPVAAGTTAPGEPAAFAAARRVLLAFGMDPGQWAMRSIAVGGARTVIIEPTDEVPVFPFTGVTKPSATVRVDTKGVQQFTVVPVRLTPRRVEILSQAEAFAKVTQNGRYVTVRRVLAAASADALTPYWEFEDDDRTKVPVSAVLTP